ncbi:acetyl-CoA carboxylase, carboxyltransferase subunit beta [Streptomyces sp. ME19-01-6]|uniref:acetyl-CoA carboxylase, carboxyltransferase subunit beta n=1 Tax=Streptomyces sp. ME19-01-6 TaxID=3028686 RepID=UPI0029BB1022|nr:acetyl-CoA carboxylase, carboxyltransferase subunit beta [Streptomyces sp. ME19-01-6]MDX3228781.1 acetyl-CoA carboxylase, carboxyltransferase subunit beta [Streptomyces sp. ME19-01-6]
MVADWVRCERCADLIYGKRFARTLRVCPDCGWHSPLTARQRLDQLLDAGSAAPVGEVRPLHDPLEFADTRPYAERLADARAKTGLTEAVICALGRIEDQPVVVAAMDFRFLGGSLGCGVGALICEAARTSLARRVPLLLITASGGARMQEGALALMQMAKTAQAMAELDEAGILTVSLITDPTYGGVAASYATLADVIVAEPGARLGFAGPRVIEQTTGERLPEGFQTAEFLMEHGMVDDIVPRSALRPTLARLLALGHVAPPEPATPASADEPEATAAGPRGGRHAAHEETARSAVVRCVGEVVERDAWEAVRGARHPERPTVMDYIGHILDDFLELHGDRLTEDCPAVVGGPGRLGGRPVMVIGQHKGGASLTERQAHRFGMPAPSGYRKSARLMRMAAKLGLPVVTLVDTPGANPGPDAERGGQALAIAENLRLMARLPVPVVAAVVGEGGSGGALALAVADRVLISAGGVYSVISPEGCAAILWKNPEAARTAAAALRLAPRELLRLGVVDGVVPEPPDGAHRDPAKAAALLGDALAEALGELVPWDPDRLLGARAERFRRFGLDTGVPAGSAGAQPHTGRGAS